MSRSSGEKFTAAAKQVEERPYPLEEAVPLVQKVKFAKFDETVELHLANLPMRNDQAYVGHSAFAHKGGVHVSAVLKDSATYEHVSPKSVGNRQRVLLSDLSGKGNVLYKLKQHGLEDRLDDTGRRELLDRMKQMEFQGYELEAAEGTFELLVRQALWRVSPSTPHRLRRGPPSLLSLLKPATTPFRNCVWVSIP